MEKYVCSICGYIYDEATGTPEVDIAPGTLWQDVPGDWLCPFCGATKAEFTKADETLVPLDKKPQQPIETPTGFKELSALELSALCANLARGCEKQYKPEEAVLFTQLAEYFKAGSSVSVEPDFAKLLELIENDIQEVFPNANFAASEVKDRGALRALVWSEKVTRIQKTLLNRYMKDADEMLRDTGVYVCTICGFIYIGNSLPDVCPVCKVPNWKFEKIEGGN